MFFIKIIKIFGGQKLVINMNKTEKNKESSIKIKESFQISKKIDYIDVQLPYLELINVLIQNRSEYESFLKECQFIDLLNPKHELVLRYTKGFVKQNINFNLYEFLVELEQSFNQKRQTLVFDFSNYAEILKPELLQTLYAALAKTEVLGFIQTFFSFTLDTDAIFIHLVAKYWKQLKNPTIINKFLEAVKKYPVSTSFEFILECYDVKEQIRKLLPDIRFLWMIGLKYLAENPQLYDQLLEEFGTMYQTILEKQHNYGSCALAPAD